MGESCRRSDGQEGQEEPEERSELEPEPEPHKGRLGWAGLGLRWAGLGLRWAGRNNNIDSSAQATETRYRSWLVRWWWMVRRRLALLFCPARSDLGPSSKRAVQLCARCDRAEQAANEARSNLLSLVLHARWEVERGGGIQKGTRGKNEDDEPRRIEEEITRLLFPLLVAVASK